MIVACGSSDHGDDDCVSDPDAVTRAFVPELVTVEVVHDTIAGQLVLLTADGSQRRSIGHANAFPLLWSSDGQFLTYSDGEDGSDFVRQLAPDGTAGAAKPIGIDKPWCALPDGRFVVIHGLCGGTDGAPCDVSVRALDPQTLTSTLLDGVVPDMLVCSAAGSLAWDPGDGVAVARPSGRATYPLAFGRPGLRGLAWSNDNRYLAWSNGSSTGVYDVVTGVMTRIVDSSCDALAVADHVLTAVCDRQLRRFAIDDGRELPRASVSPAFFAGCFVDGKRAFDDNDGLWVSPLGGQAVEIARGEFSTPEWRATRPRVARLEYPNMADPGQPHAPRTAGDVAIGVTVGVDRAHPRVDRPMREQQWRQAQSLLPQFRACYRRRLTAIPGLAVAIRVVFDADDPDVHGPIAQWHKGYDKRLDACVLDASKHLHVSPDASGVFNVQLTLGDPEAPDAVTPWDDPPRMHDY
jgi:hypothetical protein